mgnify:CR=1 FL=1
MEMLLLDFFSFLPVVADSFYNPVTQSLSIEVIGVGSTGKEGGNGAAGTRARKNIQEIVKLGKIRRNEITEEKKRRQDAALEMK